MELTTTAQCSCLLNKKGTITLLLTVKCMWRNGQTPVPFRLQVVGLEGAMSTSDV